MTWELKHTKRSIETWIFYLEEAIREGNKFKIESTMADLKIAVSMIEVSDED